MIRSLFTLFIIITPLLITAQTYYGKAVYVSDGDTFHFVADGTTIKIKIRLEGVDCPERSQPFGLEAKEFTMKMILNKTIKVVVVSKDRYGRYISKIKYDDNDLSEALLINGYAWHYTYYNQEINLANAQALARKNKVGLWKDTNPEAPWEYRRKN